jgi:ketosteroid isomerase-like protein
MSQENVDRLREGFEAFARGDVDAVLERFHDEFEWSPAIAPLLGVETIRDKDELRRFFTEDLFDGFDEFRSEPLSIEDFGDAILVTTRYVGRGEHSGLEVDQVYASVYWIRDGRTYRFRDYLSKDEALAAIEAGAAKSPRT